MWTLGPAGRDGEEEALDVARQLRDSETSLRAQLSLPAGGSQGRWTELNAIGGRNSHGMY